MRHFYQGVSSASIDHQPASCDHRIEAGDSFFHTTPSRSAMPSSREVAPLGQFALFGWAFYGLKKRIPGLDAVTMYRGLLAVGRYARCYSVARCCLTTSSSDNLDRTFSSHEGLTQDDFVCTVFCHVFAAPSGVSCDGHTHPVP